MRWFGLGGCGEGFRSSGVGVVGRSCRIVRRILCLPYRSYYFLIQLVLNYQLIRMVY